MKDADLGIDLATRIVAAHGATEEERARLGFDPDRVAASVWKRASEAKKWDLTGGEDRVVVARRAIRETYAALNAQVDGPLLPGIQEMLRLAHLRQQWEEKASQQLDHTSRQLEEMPGRVARELASHFLARPTEAPYWSTVRELAGALRTEVVAKRDEVRLLHSFAGSEGGDFLWLIGQAFVGKTTLLLGLVLEPPAVDVDCVCYFLRRTSGTADGSHYLRAVIPQLEHIVDEPEGANNDIHRYHRLWELAARRAAEQNRHLLLVVDGLDEDLGPAGVPSVTQLVPVQAGGFVHVLLSSRSERARQQLRAADHPAGHGARVPLPGFTGWRRLRENGLAEIDALSEAGGRAVEVFGLLAAAGGVLTADDLAVLCSDSGEPSAALRSEIRQIATRSVTARTLLDIDSPDGSTGLQYAHTALLEHARRNADLADPEYLERLHLWADRWAERRWVPPEAVPRYLLETYPGLLLAENTDGARFDRRFADVDFLASVDRALVALLAERAGADPAHALQVRITRRAAAAFVPHDPAANAAALQEAAVALTGTPPEGQRLIPSHRTLLADARRDDSLIPPIWNSRPPESVVTAPVDGRDVLVVGGGPYVAIHDARTGFLIRELPPLDQQVSVGALDVATMEGVPAVACVIRRQRGARSRREAVYVLPLDADGPHAHDALPGSDGMVTAHGNPRTSVCTLAFGAVGSSPLVAVGTRGGHLSVWDAQTRSLLCARIAAHTQRVTTLSFLPEQGGETPVLLSGSIDGTLALTDPRTGRLEALIPAHPATGVRGATAAAAATGVVIATAGDGASALWHVDPGLLRVRRATRSPTLGGISAVALGFDRRRLLLALGAENGAIHFWDVEGGRQVGEPLLGHTDTITEIQFATQADRPVLITASADSTIRMWALPSMQSVIAPPAGRSAVTAAALTQAGSHASLLAGHADGSVTIYDAPGQTRHLTTEVHAQVNAVAGFQLDSAGWIAAGDTAGALHIWQLPSGILAASVADAHRPTADAEWAGGVSAISIITDPQVMLASSGYDNVVRTWRFSHSRLVELSKWEVRGPVTDSYWLQRTSDTAMLVTLDLNGTLTAWQTDPPRRVASRHSVATHSITVVRGPDRGGVRFLTQDVHGSVRLWDPISDEEGDCPIRRPLRHLRSAAHIRTGKGHSLLFTLAAHSGRRVKAWRFDNGEELAPMRRRLPALELRSLEDLLLIRDAEGFVLVTIP